jgi:hypothetical protein
MGRLEDAQDLIQGFFERVLAKDFFGRVDLRRHPSTVLSSIGRV